MKDTRLNYTLNIIARWFVGLVFLFSSFTKGVDPLGTGFKVQEYMTAWSIGGFTFEWALPMANFLSVALICAEFVVGVLLITGAFRRLSAWLLVAMMLFFTVTTLIDAITNKVTDCGCFGDAVKLTNWQTFWKNVVLDVPTVWIFLTQKLRYRPRFERDMIILIAAVAVMIGFEVYNINNEPCIDFRSWKVGKRMMQTDESLQMKSYMTYKNLQTGEEVEIETKDWEAYQDETVWQLTGTRVVDPHEIDADGFSMLDMDGNDMSVDMLSSPDYLLIATLPDPDLDEIGPKGLRALKAVTQFAMDNDIQMVVLASALPEDVQSFLYANELQLDFYGADEKAILVMARAMPAFVLMKDGVVMGKWHYRNFRKVLDYDFEGNDKETEK
ncbi:MAG: DoxX family protein [Bacteroidales bacterium]|nr:DoxX family protein [Bacteroidales bacterium]